MLANEVKEELMLACFFLGQCARNDLQNMSAHVIKMSMYTFSLNTYCEEDCFQLFRYRVRDIAKITQICSCKVDKKRRSGYIVAKQRLCAFCFKSFPY